MGTYRQTKLQMGPTKTNNSPIDILSPDFVLLGVLAHRVLDLKHGVVVRVCDGDPLVVLQHSLIDGPGLVGDRLADNIHGPRVGLADLLGKLGKIRVCISYIDLL